LDFGGKFLEGEKIDGENPWFSTSQWTKLGEKFMYGDVKESDTGEPATGLNSMSLPNGDVVQLKESAAAAVFECKGYRLMFQLKRFANYSYESGTWIPNRARYLLKLGHQLHWQVDIGK
jgi:hypothetical protein